MIRRVINIDREKCNGCGICVTACHEGAIGLVGGKAQLMRDDYCDGLGDCLPACPENAITFVEREAAAYDEEAVQANMAKKNQPQMMTFSAEPTPKRTVKQQAPVHTSGESQLSQWPVKIKLVPVKAPFFEGANLLIAADCSAFAFGDFHDRFIKKRVTLIGCPKLDNVDYSEKLTSIIKENNIKNITIVRMEVPCCGGLTSAVTTAMKNSGKMIPWQVVTISSKGEILED
ncbi:ATP-binding protein [Youngiibacter multivorans]|uniref:Fe-S-cluster-containing hydrogenase component 2 n=1 Tax=Youngiibacter multivorans TaxID=937251 RepID=A0ABS4G411_9CLOT|nr:4Fe-4S dicluster domain-containing protein [Youngiibacter multivorans]MBP1919266.1 Fe-S-cluster-containing hydrogenase component 2 [Youngiibacter multivorans]